MRNGITDRMDVGRVGACESGELTIGDRHPSKAIAEADTNAGEIAVVPFCGSLMLAAGACPSASWPQACAVAAICGAVATDPSWQD